MSYDSPAFYPSSSAAADAAAVLPGQSPGASTMSGADPASDHKREHGQSLYPKVAAIQPVSQHFSLHLQ